MIGYVTIGTADMERAKAFYLELLADQGAAVFMDSGRFAAIGTEPDKPLLGICIPFNEEAPNPGNGNMVAMAGGSSENVDAMHARALSLGATDEGAPGPRGDGFYGAYFRDLDGNKMCFFHIG